MTVTAISRLTAMAAAAAMTVLAGGCASATHNTQGHAQPGRQATPASSIVWETTTTSASASPVPMIATPGVPTPTGPAPIARFAGGGLSFRYPAAWHVGTWQDNSSFSSLIVALSTARQHNPCTVTVSSTETSVYCAAPVGALLPEQLIVEWTARGFPFRQQPAPNTTVGGLPARETHIMSGWCAALRGSQAITVVIPVGGAGTSNWIEMDACLRGPGLSRPQAQIAAMLTSVRFSPRGV